jgi:multiple RNA-binding domain-containing protein 1
MSRLIIKNLPTYVTPAKLREHFEQKGGPGGTLTDVKVSSKPDGTSRRFGFVGFKSEQEAAAAQKWFDRTFIDSTRINVNVTEVSLYFSFLNHSLFNSLVFVGREGRPCSSTTQTSAA